MGEREKDRERKGEREEGRDSKTKRQTETARQADRQTMIEREIGDKKQVLFGRHTYRCSENIESIYLCKILP